MKIAIVGCFPTHWEQAPWEDKSWEIWGFSRRHMGKLPRCDRWFEIHYKSDHRRFEDSVPGYIKWCIAEGAVMHDDFPFEQLVERFGPYFFNAGQVSWLFAYAILHCPTHIGFWGIEADGGYKPQRFEVHHFAQIAVDLGIELVVPPGCRLLDAPPYYGWKTAVQDTVARTRELGIIP